MDCAPNINIFRELQVVLDTGYFSGQISPEEDWQQVSNSKVFSKGLIISKSIIYNKTNASYLF